MTRKEEILRKNACFNQNHSAVSAPIFDTSPFFDKTDIVQVKYEMLRAGTISERNVAKISSEFGFSRKTYYQINEAFQSGGISALLPKKKGPQKSHKITDEAANFIDSYKGGKAKPQEIVAALEAEMGIKVHIRTIYRYLKKNP